MKLKIKALTNQNVCIDTYTYPPYSDIECELDIKDIPIYSKSFEEWEIIAPIVLDNKDVVCTTLCIDEHDEQSKPQSEISKENKLKEIKANDGTRKKATRQTKV